MEIFTPSAMDKQDEMIEEAPSPLKWETVSPVEGKSEEAFRAEVVAKVMGYSISAEIAQKLVSELDYVENCTFRFSCYDDQSGKYDPDGAGQRTINIESSASWNTGTLNSGVFYWPDSGKVRVERYSMQSSVVKEYTL